MSSWTINSPRALFQSICRLHPIVWLFRREDPPALHNSPEKAVQDQIHRCFRFLPVAAALCEQRFFLCSRVHRPTTKQQPRFQFIFVLFLPGFWLGEWGIRWWPWGLLSTSRSDYESSVVAGSIDGEISVFYSAIFFAIHYTHSAVDRVLCRLCAFGLVLLVSCLFGQQHRFGLFGLIIITCERIIPFPKQSQSRGNS